MKNFEIQFNDFRPLSHEEMKGINGGYGYHPSNAPGAQAVGKALWSGISDFVSGFAEGYENARRHNGRLH